MSRSDRSIASYLPLGVLPSELSEEQVERIFDQIIRDADQQAGKGAADVVPGPNALGAGRS